MINKDLYCVEIQKESMAGGSEVAEAALSCAKCGKPAHLQYVSTLCNFCIFF